MEHLGQCMYERGLNQHKNAKADAHTHTLQVIETLNPVLAFYENVIGAAKRTKSKGGIISKPAVEVVQADMQKLGYQFVA